MSGHKTRPRYPKGTSQGGQWAPSEQAHTVQSKTELALRNTTGADQFTILWQGAERSIREENGTWVTDGSLTSSSFTRKVIGVNDRPTVDEMVDLSGIVLIEMLNEGISIEDDMVAHELMLSSLRGGYDLPLKRGFPQTDLLESVRRSRVNQDLPMNVTIKQVIATFKGAQLGLDWGVYQSDMPGQGNRAFQGRCNTIDESLRKLNALIGISKDDGMKRQEELSDLRALLAMTVPLPSCEQTMMEYIQSHCVGSEIDQTTYGALFSLWMYLVGSTENTDALHQTALTHINKMLVSHLEYSDSQALPRLEHIVRKASAYYKVPRAKMLDDERLCIDIVHGLLAGTSKRIEPSIPTSREWIEQFCQDYEFTPRSKP